MVKSLFGTQTIACVGNFSISKNTDTALGNIAGDLYELLEQRKEADERVAAVTAHVENYIAPKKEAMQTVKTRRKTNKYQRGW